MATIGGFNWYVDGDGHKTTNYRSGKIIIRGKQVTATYQNRRCGKPYEALADGGYFSSVERAIQAIDRAEKRQEMYLAQFDAQTYSQAKALNRVGVRWPKPKFWNQAPTEVLEVVYVGERFLLSTKTNQGGPRFVYLSSFDSDCEEAFVYRPDEHGNLADAINRWVTWFTKPIPPRSSVCHYCGQPADGIGFFGEPACRECGG